MNIYLVGFMGTGKTSVGRQLAKDQGWNFIDLDELIELKQQRRIVDIFAQEGEPYFRKIEKKFLNMNSVDIKKRECYINNWLNQYSIKSQIFYYFYKQ